MEDVGRVVEPTRLSPVSEPTSISTLDGWIESLMSCKQLAEVDVQRLCEKVSLGYLLPMLVNNELTSGKQSNNIQTGERGSTGGVKRSASRKLTFVRSGICKL